MAIVSRCKPSFYVVRNVLSGPNQQFRKNTQKIGNKADDELEFAMYDFAFYSIKTVLLHSGNDKTRSPKLAEACINAARASFVEIQHMRGMGAEGREGREESRLSIDGLISLGNWYGACPSALSSILTVF